MVLRWLILGVACALLASAAVTPRKARKTPQPDCDPNSCTHPGCTCASVNSPLFEEYDLEELPQFVVLSFDDAIKVDNFDFYKELINTYTNYNGCPISMTYFITHKYNNYANVNEMHRLGSEIAAHSVSHKPDVEGYWRPADYDTWFSEINDVKQMIMKYGKIEEDQIKGWRAPFLETGGDIMYNALVDAGFSYDCSISTYRYSNWYTIEGEPEPRGALYPFTMDYKSDLQCSVGTCPEQVYPGFWVTPMIDLNDPRSWTKEVPSVRAPCNMLDSCVGGNTTSDDFDCESTSCKDNLYNWLKESFHNHYDNNKAPFGLYTHYGWLQMDEIQGSHHKDAYLQFLDYIQDLDDVWIVSMATVVEYMKDPQLHEDMGYWPPVSCIPPPTTNCPDPITCSYENPPFAEANHVEMTICTRPCPENYPWLGNIDGN